MCLQLENAVPLLNDRGIAVFGLKHRTCYGSDLSPGLSLNLFLLPWSRGDYVKDEVKDQGALHPNHPGVATITNS